MYFITFNSKCKELVEASSHLGTYTLRQAQFDILN